MEQKLGPDEALEIKRVNGWTGEIIWAYGLTIDSGKEDDDGARKRWQNILMLQKGSKTKSVTTNFPAPPPRQSLWGTSNHGSTKY